VAVALGSEKAARAGRSCCFFFAWAFLNRRSRRQNPAACRAGLCVVPSVPSRRIHLPGDKLPNTLRLLCCEITTTGPRKWFRRAMPQLLVRCAAVLDGCRMWTSKELSQW